MRLAAADPGDTENPEVSYGEAICFLTVFFCLAIRSPADTEELFTPTSCISQEHAHEESFLAMSILENSIKSFY